MREEKREEEAASYAARRRRKQCSMNMRQRELSEMIARETRLEKRREQTKEREGRARNKRVDCLSVSVSLSLSSVLVCLVELSLIVDAKHID